MGDHLPRAGDLIDSCDLGSPLAIVGGCRATGLVEVTDDLSVLDTSGFWVVVIPFEGAPICARFESVTRHVHPCAGAWDAVDPASWSTSLDRAGFEGAVAEIHGLIADGDVYQVNLTRRLSTPRTPRMDIAALGALLELHNPAPYPAVIRLPEHGVEIASASPELFLSRSDRTVCSSPIKGTAPSPDLFTGKDRAENLMIVDLVRNDLGRVCEFGSVRVPSLFSTEAHPGLVHLVSTVTGTLRPHIGWPELIDATFPPGSVTGAPKIASLQAITALEPVPRGPYCGAIGWVDADRRTGVLNVAIRTFWLSEDQLHLATGGAITWDSTGPGEWAETELKAANLISAASLSGVPRHRGGQGSDG